VADHHNYHAFGLSILSEIELPDLFPNDVDVAADVAIAFGAVPSPGDPSTEFDVNERGAFLFIAGVARYWISGGSRIMIEVEAGASLRNVRLFLLGSAMGILIHQRGLLPLHANAVEIGGRAFAFIGKSGAGKSTLAAAFHDRGYGVIADDVCVVRFREDGQAVAYPGIPRLRLWEEALTATGREAASYELSYAGDESFRKFDVPTQLHNSEVSGIPLAAVYELAQGSKFHIRRLEGAAAAESIFANTYRGAYVRSAGNPRVHWSASLQLVMSTPIFELERVWDLADIGNHLDRIIGHAANVISEARR
jgi:hypothetical protein